VTALSGAAVKIILEIHACVPRGDPDHVVRTATANSRMLWFNTAELSMTRRSVWATQSGM
jgi:hypothetical protein